MVKEAAVKIPGLVRKMLVHLPMCRAGAIVPRTNSRTTQWRERRREVAIGVEKEGFPGLCVVAVIYPLRGTQCATSRTDSCSLGNLRRVYHGKGAMGGNCGGDLSVKVNITESSYEAFVCPQFY
ncbi:Uncharacterized protein HZ326_18939 [Fusarium oxysporum f. sp. albedinis]|nr:Uncharacterized protein HZ326_18939 [Fusarium oxysporum f. sp. albedinis]